MDAERVDTEVAQTAPRKKIFSTIRKSVSAAWKAIKLRPSSSGKSASSEPGGPGNKDPVFCPPAISSGTQSMTAELAMTSKIPHGEKSPLASRRNEEHPAQYHNTHTSEHAKDGVLNESTHGEASEQTQSQDILKSRNKMKHLFGKTNTEEIIDSECPSSAETLGNFLGGTTLVPHLSTFINTLSGESQEEEAHDDLLPSWHDSQSSSAGALPHSAHNLHSQQCLSSESASSGGAPDGGDGCSLTPLPEQTSPPRVPPPTPTTYHSAGFVACTQWTQRLPRLHNGRASRRGMAPSPGTSVCEKQYTLVIREDNAVQKGTSTTHALQSSQGASGPNTSAQPDDTTTITNSEEQEDMQESQDVQGGEAAAAAAQNAQSLEDNNKDTECRAKPSLSVELSNEDEEDQCRFCHSGDCSPANPLLSPCLCSGSLHFIHLDCLKEWIQTKFKSGSEPHDIKRCEICMGELTLDPDTFDLDDYCRSLKEQQQMSLTEIYCLQEEAHIRILTIRRQLSEHSSLYRLRRIREIMDPSSEPPDT